MAKAVPLDPGIAAHHTVSPRPSSNGLADSFRNAAVSITVAPLSRGTAFAMPRQL